MSCTNRSPKKEMVCRDSSRRVAFTLIELLVVVAIIALLISILLPSLASAREGARSSLCLSNTRQMASGVLLYATDQKSSLPGPLHMCIYQNTSTYSDRAPNGGIVTGDPSLYWGVQLPYYIQRYLSDASHAAKVVDQVGTCPSAESALPRDTRELVLKNGLRTWHYCVNSVVRDASKPEAFGTFPYYQTDPPAYFGVLSMGVKMSAWLKDDYRSLNVAPAKVTDKAPKKVDVIRKASQEWMVADGWYWDARLGLGATRPAGTYPYSTSATGADILSVIYNGTLTVPSYPFHNTTKGFDANLSNPDHKAGSPRLTTGKTNAAFFDGHAASIRVWKGSANPLIPVTK